MDNLLDGPNPQRAPVQMKFNLSGPKLQIDPIKINQNLNQNYNMNNNNNNMNQYMINNPNNNIQGIGGGYGLPQNQLNNIGGGYDMNMYQPYQQPMNINYQQNPQQSK